MRSIANNSKNGLNDCQTIKIWAKSIPLMRKLMQEDELYLDELFLLSLIYTLSASLSRPLTKTEVINEFNVLSYKRDKMLLNLIGRGLVNNDIEGPRAAGNTFKLIVSPLGEQLLIKYNKAMIKLCEGDK